MEATKSSEPSTATYLLVLAVLALLFVYFLPEPEQGNRCFATGTPNAQEIICEEPIRP